MTYRFGVFEFASESGELRKSGRTVALEPQPSRALGVLLAHADRVVTREELKLAVWGKETHVDFDRGLAYCVSQIRTALGDSGDSPRYIQTLPKKGYRFIAPVHAPLAEQTAVPPSQSDTRSRPAGLRPYAILAGIVLAIVGIGTGLALRTRPNAPERVIVAVSVFDNETGIADYDRVVAGLSDLVVTRLAELSPDRVAVIGNASVLRQPRNIRNLKAVAAGVKADYVVLGQLQQGEAGLRFITHFIRLSDETHLKANRIALPARDLAGLEQQVVAEFERAVQEHVLKPARNPLG
jgi:DNA-binding winged helix-turn-helix (wHTH) protein/TolB-like protein